MDSFDSKTGRSECSRPADGLPNNVVMTVLASQDGGLWTGAIAAAFPGLIMDDDFKPTTRGTVS